MKNLSRETVSQAAYFVLISLIWLVIGWVLRSQFVTRQTSLEDQVKQIIQDDFPGEIPSEADLSFAAVQGMLSIVDDPFAVVVPPPSSLKFAADMAGETGIVGLVPNINEAGQMYIETVIPGSTADLEGVRVGDILLSIDGIPVNAATTVTGSALLFRGPVGEPAQLVVERNGEILNFAPVRVERVALEWEILDNGVGYIAQYTFTTNVPKLFDEALAAIMATNPPAIIWDVRFNGGGSMTVAQDVLSNFIEDGPLFEVTLKDGETRLFSAEGDAAAPDVPLYVLVNEFTYSAAETVASTIQETGRGTTIGATTYGKGTIQNSVPLPDDYLFEYTIGYWHTPNGVSYQGVGFTPAINAPDDPETAVDETIEAALAQISSRD
ncbi:MAG: PDZ domain-containing protein [Ardenticatenaceae bacterium]|nr:PDZ domain-containing protein [Ardenticatenaceae bacterium]